MNRSGNQQRSDPPEEVKKQALEYRMMLEFHMMREFALAGTFVFPQLDNLMVWHGVIFVKDWDYKGGVFKFRIDIPLGYPNEPPQVVFKVELYHPLINPSTQVLELLPQVLDWTPKKDCLIKVLAYIKKAFYSPELWSEENVANVPARNAYISDKGLFASHVKESIRRNEERLRDADESSSIRFSNFTAEHQQLMEKLKLRDSSDREADQFDTFLRWFRKRFSQSHR